MKKKEKKDKMKKEVKGASKDKKSMGTAMKNKMASC